MNARRTLPFTYEEAFPVAVAVVGKMTVLAPVVILPLVNVRVVFTVMLLERLIPLALLTVRLLNVVAVVPLMVCAPEAPLNMTVPVPWVKALLFVQLPTAEEFPVTVMV